jgi:hypothetical protein
VISARRWEPTKHAVSPFSSGVLVRFRCGWCILREELGEVWTEGKSSEGLDDLDSDRAGSTLHDSPFNAVTRVLHCMCYRVHCLCGPGSLASPGVPSRPQPHLDFPTLPRPRHAPPSPAHRARLYAASE